MSVVEPQSRRQTGRAASSEVGEPVTKETGIPEGIPTTAAHRRRSSVRTKKSRLVAVVRLVYPSRQTRSPFSRRQIDVNPAPQLPSSVLCSLCRSSRIITREGITMTLYLNRQDLYLDVWRRPLGYLSRDLGVTSAALRKACNSMSIPTPSQSYWAALKAGKVPPVAPLPPHDGPNVFALGSRPRQTLVEWLETSMPNKPPPPPEPPSVKTGTVESGMPRWVPLRVWATLLFGEYAPHYNTLLRWVHDGRIVPAAKKVGRRWFVQPSAQYISD